jgi:hypothetical protein
MAANATFWHLMKIKTSSGLRLATRAQNTRHSERQERAVQRAVEI